MSKRTPSTQRKARLFARITKQFKKHGASPHEYAAWLRLKDLADDRRDWDSDAENGQKAESLQEFLSWDRENACGEAYEYVKYEYDFLQRVLDEFGRIYPSRKVA